MITKICPTCKKEFTTKYKKQVRCSLSCRLVWNKGKNWSNEVKNKISQTKKGNSPAWNKGKKWSEEVKNKISQTKKLS